MTKAYSGFPVALVFAFLLAGCGSVLQSMPAIGKYRQLLVGSDLANHDPTIEILQIQRVGDPEIIHDPKPKNGFLWLRSGKYTVKLKCNVKPGIDPGDLIMEPTITPLPPDLEYSFDIEKDYFGLDCRVTETGQVLILSGEVLMID